VELGRYACLSADALVYTFMLSAFVTMWIQLEQYYKDRREEEIKHLLEKMAVEEQAAITRLIDKHSQEMLLMIQEKVYTLQVLYCFPFYVTGLFFRISLKVRAGLYGSSKEEALAVAGARFLTGWMPSLSPHQQCQSFKVYP